MVDTAEVYIWNQKVGALRWEESQQLAYFQYHPNFLKSGWELSPIKMPLDREDKVYAFPENRVGRNSQENTFKGLPGLLADALPDRYGHRLIDLWLAKNGRLPGSMNPLETLCFIGQRAMGALEFQPSRIKIKDQAEQLEIEGLVAVAGQMLNEREKFLTQLDKNTEKAMTQILKIGTSAGGARPKALVAYNPATGSMRSGQGKSPRGFEQWLLKLDGVDGAQFGDSHGWGRVEYAYYLMAIDAGIEIMESGLFEENGRAHFMTKRFDRENNIKHHVQTLCGLQHYDYNDMYGYSYEQLFLTMRALRLSYPEAEEMFRRMVFNVLASNYDDHTKNFSFMLKKNDRWRLAPAYDLCFAYDPNNFWVSQQTLSINGKRRNITKADLLKIAKENSIKKGEDILEGIKDVVANWNRYAERAGVRHDVKNRIWEQLNFSRDL